MYCSSRGHAIISISLLGHSDVDAKKRRVHVSERRKHAGSVRSGRTSVGVAMRRRGKIKDDDACKKTIGDERTRSETASGNWNVSARTKLGNNRSVLSFYTTFYRRIAGRSKKRDRSRWP